MLLENLKRPNPITTLLFLLLPFAVMAGCDFLAGQGVDTRAPTVISTSPSDAATGVAINQRISATFSKSMNVSSLDAAFSVTGPDADIIAGKVAFDTATNIATITLPGYLATNTAYTATWANGARDLNNTSLAETFTWRFTTGATADTTAPTVLSSNPADLATGVPLNKRINATFSEAMDPSTISVANYTLTGPGPTPVTGSVTYDAAGHTTTFAPLTNLAANTAYTAMLTRGCTDLAGNALVNVRADSQKRVVWNFTTGTTVDQEPVNLRSLSTFAVVAGAGLTNSNSAGQTTINGDVGLSPTATCLGDGSPCSALDPLINGTLYANDPAGVAAAAKADLTVAYNDAAGRPPGTTVNDISGMVLAPGVYTSGSTMSIAVGGTVTLDAQGDAYAAWIFQIGSSLTVNNNAQVLLINGAKASNVYWAIAASSTLGTNVSFKGNVLAGASNSVGTGSVVEGRLLSQTGQITLLSNTLTIPVP